MANEKRNASIDITKFILALIVVMLHSATECLGTEHMAVRVIEYSGRFVVQFFLMVSGYYFTKMCIRDRSKSLSEAIGRESVKYCEKYCLPYRVMD